MCHLNLEWKIFNICTEKKQKAAALSELQQRKRHSQSVHHEKAECETEKARHAVLAMH